LQQPVLAVALRIELLECRKAGSDRRERHCILWIRRRLRHDAPGAVSQLIETPELLRRVGERRHDCEFVVGSRSQRTIRAGDGDLEVRRSRISAGLGHGRELPFLLCLAQVVTHGGFHDAGRPIRLHLRRRLVGNRRTGPTEQATAAEAAGRAWLTTWTSRSSCVGRASRSRSSWSTCPLCRTWTSGSAGAIPWPWACTTTSTASAHRPKSRTCAHSAATDRHTCNAHLQSSRSAHGLDFVGSFLRVLASHWPAVLPQQWANV